MLGGDIPVSRSIKGELWQGPLCSPRNTSTFPRLLCLGWGPLQPRQVAHCGAQVGERRGASSASFFSVVAESEALGSRCHGEMEGVVDPPRILCEK